MSSLKNVQDLEVESRKVPHLEARIEDLERLLPTERWFQLTDNASTMQTDPRPGKISFLDESFTMYSSESEGEELLASLPPRPPR